MAENEKPKLFGIGITGLVGSRIVEILSDRYEFHNLSLETGVDITNPSTLSVIENDTDHDIVIHLAAKADVDGCEQDKAAGKEGAAWKINVEGTRNVVNACQKAGKKMIYISTDFVFDGTKSEGTLYTEDDTPNPLNWYAETKYEGEKIVSDASIPSLIVRIAYPYRTPFAQKKDLVQAMLGRLKEGQTITAVTDHIMCPTYVDDIAASLDTLITQNSTGIFHVVGSAPLTPYELAITIANQYSLDSSLIHETTREAFFSGRAARPFNLALSNAKIEKLGLKMKTVEEGLKDLQATGL